MSVCVAICCSLSWALQRRLNRWRCQMVGPRNHVLDVCPDTQGKRAFWGLSSPLHSTESLLQCTQQKINNGISVTAAAKCHINLSPVKNPNHVMQPHIEILRLLVYSVSKKQYTWLLITTSANADKFSKFFHWQIPKKTLCYLWDTVYRYLAIALKNPKMEKMKHTSYSALQRLHPNDKQQQL